MIHRMLSYTVGFAAMVFAAGLYGAEPPVPAPTAADTLFEQPYVDVDEWRDEPVRHRYVHGGFKGTETLFSFYFPPRAQYQGRFFQHVTPAPLSETLEQRMPPGEFNKIGFAIASGAYFIETNGGGQGRMDSSITAYRANAAAALYSRVVALKMYGGKRPYGYLYGGSGGGYRTIGSMENTRDVWDGAVPYVIGSPMAIPNVFTVRMHALRVLDQKLPQIVDALEPGGSGDPYAGLDADEAAALREVTQMGFPLRSWFGYRNIGLHGLGALYGGVVAADPTYFTDFWTKPGYLGFDHRQQLEKERIRYRSTVAARVTAAELQRLTAGPATGNVNGGGVDTAFRGVERADAAHIAAFRLAERPPQGHFLGGDLNVLSGAAKGEKRVLNNIIGDVIVLWQGDSVSDQIAVGDEVEVDNSNFLALETYHRHQVPSADYTEWNQYRGADGKPIYPQRPMLLGPLFVRATAGSLETGRFQGKMIVVASLLDREAFPWQADWYRSQVRSNLGERTDKQLRLWYTDRALHGDEPELEDPTRVVSYNGMLQEALRDVSAWVEKSIPPPASTEYRVEGGQVIVPDTAAARLGIQPVVSLKVNGTDRVQVSVNEPVTFTGSITVPPGAGSIVAAEWDFDGHGSFPERSSVSKGRAVVTISMTHRFAKPGTYFPALRGISQRQWDPTAPYARLQNLGRVRIVVQ